MRARTVVLAVVTLALVAARARSAQAQRGAAFIEQQAPPETPLSGFPGLADANTVPAGHVVADLPFLSVDVGLTDNLSAGVNGFFLLPLAVGNPSFFGRSRYRWFSSRRVVSVIDGMAGYLSSGDGEDTWLFMVGSNTTVHFGRLQSVNVTALAGRASSDSKIEGVEGATEHSETSALALAATYQINPLDWLALRFTVAQLPVVFGQVDSSFQFAELQIGADKGLWKRTVARALASFRLGQNWLLDAGAAVHTSGLTIPWLSIAKKW